MYEGCDNRFRVKYVDKPFVGYFNKEPVFHWYFLCPDGHVNFVRFYNKFVNPYYDEMKLKEVAMLFSKWDKEKFEELKIEFKQAEEELERINDEVRKVCGLDNMRRINHEL